MTRCVMEASEPCAQISDMWFHVEMHSNLRKYDKTNKNKNNHRDKPPPPTITNQSEATVLAAVYTSHQVWCLQRLSERPN